MKRTFLLFTLSAALAVITLNSNSSGPANNSNGNKTGGPGSSGTCGTCHSGATGATGNVSLRLKSDNTPANDKYTPGQTYIVTVSGSHASLPKFGFQLMALKDPNNTQAGTFGGFTDQHSKTVSGIILVEQHQTLSKTGSAFTTEFEWTAPAAGTGNIKFHGILNAVNGTGGTDGDAVSPAFSKTLAEGPNAITDITADNNIRLYPNPVQDQLHVSFSQTGNYTVSVYSLDGKIIINKQVNSNTKEISMPAEMASGTYLLEVTNGQERKTIPFLKR